jgi:hypothetical protein
MSGVTAFIRRSWRVAKALWRFAKAHVPKWMLPVLAVCLVIPGPVDECLVLVPIAWVVLRHRDARAELGASVREAWNSN